MKRPITCPQCETCNLILFEDDVKFEIEEYTLTFNNSHIVYCWNCEYESFATTETTCIVDFVLSEFRKLLKNNDLHEWDWDEDFVTVTKGDMSFNDILVEPLKRSLR